MAGTLFGLIAAFAVGLVFGIGLVVSGMINPSKVLGFLDFAVNRDPTHNLVMAGSLIAAAPGFAIARHRRVPITGGEFEIPTTRTVDAPLIVGTLLFGIGWGLVGFCPGPANAAAGTGLPEVYVFVAAMTAGMALLRLYSVSRSRN